jgi:hypothetical protein
LSFWVWLISLSILFSQLVYYVAWIRPLFLWLSNIPLSVNSTFCFIYLFVGDLGYSYTLAKLNNAAINTGIYLLIRMFVFNSFGYISTSGIPGPYNLFNFLKNKTTKMFSPFYFPTSNVWGL